MASLLWGSSNASMFFLLLLSFHFFSATSIDFIVGDADGWAIPKAKEGEKYNEWASKNRFNVNDTVHFKYSKDSVMVVSEEEYSECHSLKPIFYANNGDTVIKIDRAGLFYFISGVSGHCERGQKMIIKVLEPPKSTNDTAAPPLENTAPGFNSVSSPEFGILLLMSFVSAIFF